MQTLMNAFCKRRTNTRDSFQILNARIVDALATAEMTQKRLQFLGSQTKNVLERVAQPTPLSTFPMEGVDKSMCFITRMNEDCLLYTSPSPRDATLSRMPSSA